MVYNTFSSQEMSEADDDFEVVPQDQEDDADMWDGDDEDQNEAVQAKIKSKYMPLQPR